jgi:hypothetical protein
MIGCSAAAPTKTKIAMCILASIDFEEVLGVDLHARIAKDYKVVDAPTVH